MHNFWQKSVHDILRSSKLTIYLSWVINSARWVTSTDLYPGGSIFRLAYVLAIGRILYETEAKVVPLGIICYRQYGQPMFSPRSTEDIQAYNIAYHCYVPSLYP